MRISDWSSDVCSSDLYRVRRKRHRRCEPVIPGGCAALLPRRYCCKRASGRTKASLGATMARTSVKGVPRRLAAATAAILYVALPVPRPAQALDKVIDQAAIGKLVDQINALKQQLAEMKKDNGLLKHHLNAPGRPRRI